jgi:hypothetical protein
MDAIKAIIIIIITLLIFFPMLPFGAKIKKICTIYALRYDQPHNRKNLFFVLLSTIFSTIILVLLGVFDKLAEIVSSVPFINDLFSVVSNATSSMVDFITTVVLAVLVNVIIVYGYSFLKFILKKCILDPAFGLAAPHKLKKEARKSVVANRLTSKNKKLQPLPKRKRKKRETKGEF